MTVTKTPPIIFNKDTTEEIKEGEEEDEKIEEPKKEDEEEIDPLNAFMAEVQEEVREVNKIDTKPSKPGNYLLRNIIFLQLPNIFLNIWIKTIMFTLCYRYK